MITISPRTRWLLSLAIFVSALWFLGRNFLEEAWHPSPPYSGPYEAFVIDSTETHGFLPLEEAKDFCRRYRWEPYRTRNQRRKVYDLVLLNTELDVLEIRLNELNDEVDYFIVLESPNTFQMNEKPLFLQDSLDLPQFKAFKHKLIHHVLDITEEQQISREDTWGHERFTRNALFDQALLSLTGHQAPSQGDVIITGDVDEIPRLGTVTALRNCAYQPRVTLKTQMYYYSYQWLHRGPLWHHPQATYYNGRKDTIRPDSLRTHKPNVELHMAGWHCSSCFGTLAELKTKISSFSHKNFNQPYYLDTQRLLDHVRTGTDLFDRRKELYDRVDDNGDVPTYLRSNETRQKFNYMLDRDPWHANFQDLQQESPP